MLAELCMVMGTVAIIMFMAMPSMRMHAAPAPVQSGQQSVGLEAVGRQAAIAVILAVHAAVSAGVAAQGTSQPTIIARSGYCVGQRMGDHQVVAGRGGL